MPKEKPAKKSVNQKCSQKSSSSVGSSKSTKPIKKRYSKPSKNTKNSTFKNSKRNETHPNIDSFTEIDTKVDTTSKMILKTSEEKLEEEDYSTLTWRVITGLIFISYSYLFFAVFYQYFFGDSEQGLAFCLLFLVELSLGLLVAFLDPRRHRNTPSVVSFFLTLKYFHLFFYFSMFLQTPPNPKLSFFSQVFDFQTVTLFLSVIQFFLVIEFIEFLSNSKILDDFSDQIIVEGVEKRDEKMAEMITELVEEIMRDDSNLKVFFTIKNENDHPKSLGETSVEAEVIRNFEMNSGENQISLSRNITTITCVDAPKEKEKRVAVDTVTVGPSSKYNDCLKQPRPLSPRKIL
ncbi:unnamed protein product [Caenorhabditis brenneri]